MSLTASSLPRSGPPRARSTIRSRTSGRPSLHRHSSRPIQIFPPPASDFAQTIGDAQSIVLAERGLHAGGLLHHAVGVARRKDPDLDADRGGQVRRQRRGGMESAAERRGAGGGCLRPVRLPVYSDTAQTRSSTTPKPGSWHSAGSTIVQLWDSGLTCGELNAAPPTPTFELGPAVLRADGTVFYTGSNTCPTGAGNTAIYDSTHGHWQPGPMFPKLTA